MNRALSFCEKTHVLLLCICIPEKGKTCRSKLRLFYLDDRASSRSRVLAMLSMKTLPQSSSVRASSGAREQS
jgi:hypothetical protein